MNDSQKGGARLMKSEHKRRELAPLLAIFGILVGLALASLLTPEREFSPNENRYLQLKPSLTWTTLMDGTFTQKAEDYVAAAAGDQRHVAGSGWPVLRQGDARHL